MKNEGGGMRSVRRSETAEANRPGYEGAAHEQGSILAEGGGFVAGGIRGAVSSKDCILGVVYGVAYSEPLILTITFFHRRGGVNS